VSGTSRDDSVTTTDAQERLKEVFELCEAAEILVRESLRRRFPNANENEIERRVGEWRHERPGAPHGDASGPHFRVRR
jgi:hypothetical protein